MNETTTCRGCVHWRRIALDSRYRVCHYAEDTGRLRDCAPDHCGYKQTRLPDRLPDGEGPWLLNEEDGVHCCACGEEIRGRALEVTDVANRPWRYAFLHPSEDCCRTFYRENTARCLEFFSWEVEKTVIAQLGKLEATV